jgi:hypothetical protein
MKTCAFLAKLHSLSRDDREIIEFALSWAPYGGATSADLLVAFGVHRDKFVELLRAALRPKSTDLDKLQDLKRNLDVSLQRAWNIDPAQTPSA